MNDRFCDINRKRRGCRVKFDIDKLNRYYENGDMKKLKSLAYTYCSEVTYLKEDDYKELNLLLITIVEKIFDIEARDVQESLFDVLINAVNINYSKNNILNKCIENLINKLKEVQIDSWELAETLLVISSTMDNKYSSFMKKFIGHEDEYVRSIVKEYFVDMTEL